MGNCVSSICIDAVIYFPPTRLLILNLQYLKGNCLKCSYVIHWGNVRHFCEESEGEIYKKEMIYMTICNKK